MYINKLYIYIYIHTICVSTKHAALTAWVLVRSLYSPMSNANSRPMIFTYSFIRCCNRGMSLSGTGCRLKVLHPGVSRDTRNFHHNV